MQFIASCFLLAALNLSQWFFTATAAQGSGAAIGKIKPDFLGGSTRHAMHCGASGIGIGGVWQLIQYDRTHHIGLAAAGTDQCSVSVFEAPPPGVNVPDADLSHYATGRGIRIGSTAKDVVAAYGGAVPKQGSHAVMRYTASIPDTTVTQKPTTDDEVLTIVVSGDRVTAITAYIDLSGLF